MLTQSWNQSCYLKPTDSDEKDMPVSVKQTTGKTVNRSSSILQVKMRSVAHKKEGTTTQPDTISGWLKNKGGSAIWFTE